jgi:hypothetical protein
MITVIMTVIMIDVVYVRQRERDCVRYNTRMKSFMGIYKLVGDVVIRLCFTLIFCKIWSRLGHVFVVTSAKTW